MDWTLGLSAFIGPGRDHRFWFRVAKELGLGAVELRAEPLFCHPAYLDRSARREISKEARDLSLSLHASIHGPNLASLNPRLAAASTEDLLETAELAAELGARVVVFHPGTLPGEYIGVPGALDRARDALRRALERAVPRAEELGVVLALENKQKSKGRDLVLTPQEHVELLVEFPGLKACLDFGHLHTLGLDPRGFVTALGDKLVHVHLHDNHGEGDEHLPLGQGTLDWKGALGALREAGYRGTVILEIPDLEGLVGSVEAVRRWAA